MIEYFDEINDPGQDFFLDLKSMEKINYPKYNSEAVHFFIDMRGKKEMARCYFLPHTPSLEGEFILYKWDCYS